jgi:hypothetical protein
MTDDRLYIRARRAYEWSRARRALPLAMLVLPPLFISVKACASDLVCLSCSIVLAAVLVACSWRGEAFARAIWPGLLAGLAAFAAPLACDSLGLCLTTSREACFISCIAGGLIAGGLIGVRMLKNEPDRTRFLAASAAIAVLFGGMGCAVAGLAGVLGMLAGAAVSAAPIVAFGRARV